MVCQTNEPNYQSDPKGTVHCNNESPVLLQTESMEKVGDPLDKLLESEKLLDSLNASRWTPWDRGRDSVLYSKQSQLVYLFIFKDLIIALPNTYTQLYPLVEKSLPVADERDTSLTAQLLHFF